MDISDITYGQLQSFIATGKTDMPENLQQYFNMLEVIRSMYSKYKSKKFILNAITISPYDIPKRSADKLYRDALNFFYSDNDVKKEAWCNIYAEKLELAAMVAWEQNDMETYGKLIMDAAELRGCKKEDAIEKEPYDRRPVVYIFDPKKLGMPEVNKKELAAFIDNLDVPEKEKQKARRDAMLLEDAEFEILPSNDED
jgi:hypothetical protein